MSIETFPQFNHIHYSSFPNELAHLLQQNLEKISTLLNSISHYTWENLMLPLEEMGDQLEKIWFPLSHLHAVVDTPAIRECYQLCLPKLSAYEAAVSHNAQLYKAIKGIDLGTLDVTQEKIIQDTLRGFELAGVALDPEKKRRFEEIQTKLAELSNQFEMHVLDASQAFSITITDKKRLKGLPDHAVATAKALADEKKLEGWVLNLEIPCYLAVVTYAEDRSLREEMYYAYVTRASDVGPNGKQFDNSTVMEEILALRHEKAQLLGLNNYAELSIATKMASTCSQVTDFLYDLSTRAYSQAQREFQDLQDFAKTYCHLQEVAPWDIAFVSEKKQQAEFSISQEQLRPYFSLPKVMSGMFSIIQQLYGMSVNEIKNIDTWHSDVQCYQIKDENQIVRGYFYTDLFARASKRGGAWMDSCQGRRKRADGSIQNPIATLTCNFAKPVGDKIPILSHDEVVTLFHEFGHCLQHILTQVDYLEASGINGVEWDAVELPSQFFENWCWEKTALLSLTAHVDTGEPLPAHVFENLINAKNFQSAMLMMRQLEFSLFDFRIHQEYDPSKLGFVASTLADVRQHTAVVPIASYNRFQHSFSHIFAGGYAAGYYSYKWAEVLSSDAFSRFEEEGILNSATGRAFLHTILETGGAQKAEQAFQAFRGRPARIDALLRHTGIE